jgi:hypothetical protein
MSNSNNNNNNNDDEREERRKASFALAHTSSTYILALSLLAAGDFAVIISTVTPMNAAIAQELDTTGQPGGGLEYSACTPTQIGGDGGGGSQNATSNATTMGGGGDANATADNATTTAGGGIGVSTSTSQVIDFIEQACIALEVGDTEGALIQLNLALDELRGGGDGTQGNTTDTQSEITGGTATSG